MSAVLSAEAVRNYSEVAARSGPVLPATVLKLTKYHDHTNPQSLMSIFNFSADLVEAVGDEGEFNITLDTTGKSRACAAASTCRHTLTRARVCICMPPSRAQDAPTSTMLC